MLAQEAFCSVINMQQQDGWTGLIYSFLWALLFTCSVTAICSELFSYHIIKQEASSFTCLFLTR